MESLLQRLTIVMEECGFKNPPRIVEAKLEYEKKYCDAEVQTGEFSEDSFKIDVSHYLDGLEVELPEIDDCPTFDSFQVDGFYDNPFENPLE